MYEFKYIFRRVLIKVRILVIIVGVKRWNVFIVLKTFSCFLSVDGFLFLSGICGFNFCVFSLVSIVLERRGNGIIERVFFGVWAFFV